MTAHRGNRKKAVWWAQVDVDWLDGDSRHQLVILTSDAAKGALEWIPVLRCRSWGQVRTVASAPVMEWLDDWAFDQLGAPQADDENFDVEDIPAFADGDIPPNPNALMFADLPWRFLEEFADRDALLTFRQAFLAAARREQALSWFADQGYQIEEHPELCILTHVFELAG